MLDIELEVLRVQLIGRDRYSKKNITNRAGMEMQATVWREILEVLEAAVPEIKAIAHAKNLQETTEVTTSEV